MASTASAPAPSRRAGPSLQQSRRRLRRWALWACLISPFAAFATLVLLAESHPDAAGLAFFVIPWGTGCIAAIRVGSSFQKRPGSILLLRPFGEVDVSRALTRLVRQEISFVGIPFTLADQHVRSASRKNGLAWFYPLGGPLLCLFSNVSYSVSTRVELNFLRNGLRARRRLAWRWLWGRRRLMVISASERLWREAIDLMLEHVDLSIVDLSEVGVGSVWEIERVQTAGAKFVFISAEARRAGAFEVVRAFFPDHEHQLFTYDTEGRLTDKQGFFRACCA